VKKKFLAFLMGTGLVLALAACGGGGDDEATGGDTVDAEKIAAQKCSSCHGENLEGQGGSANISKLGAKYSKDEIEEIILNGKGGMPGGVIKGEEASAVAEWLASKK
jgi:cytochrome c551